MLRLVGALAVVALGGVTGHGVTSAVLAARTSLATGHAPAPATATPAPARPAPSVGPDGGCCTEEGSAHARPKNLPLPSQGLHGAVARGEVPAVRAALDAGDDIDARDSEGRTLLAVAVLSGRMRVLRLLLDRGANPEITDRRHAAPVLLAAGFGDTAMIDVLISYGVKAEGANAKGHTALMIAAQGEHLDAMKLLLEHRVGVDRRCDRGMTALMYAVVAGSRAAVDLLLKRRAKTELRDARGATVLAIAAEHGRSGLAARLLDAGAAIDAADHEGLTPLGYAALTAPPLPGRWPVAKLLAARGASFELRVSPDVSARLDVARLKRLAKRHGKRLVLGEAEDTTAPAGVANRRLFHAVPRQNSRGLPARTEERLVAYRRNRRRVANVIARVEVRNLQARPGQRVTLAGDAAGRRGVRVDDALLFEAYQSGSAKLATDFVGRLEALRVDGAYAQPRIQRSRFAADEVDLTRYCQGASRLVITAVDWGGAAQLSHVFLRVHGNHAERTLDTAQVRELR